ncbi:MAG: hypothetical protein IPH89_02165 [Bacteroidetes bacterium]|nr:hypothetical protein [Bacteroidota bacterium]
MNLSFFLFFSLETIVVIGFFVSLNLVYVSSALFSVSVGVGGAISGAVSVN